MTTSESLVHVIDDDPAVRQSLQWLIESVNIKVRTYENAADYLQSAGKRIPGCLVLDIRMPGMSGLELLDHLRQLGVEIPVIIISGHADVPMTVRAMKAGAIDLIEKPFRDQDLLDCIQHAIARDAVRLRELAEIHLIRDRISSLTECEREVMELAVHGLPNKAIAQKRSCSQKTVEAHRAGVMRKMGAESFADLVRMIWFYFLKRSGENPDDPK